MASQASQIAEINFLQVDPKECIRGFKGLYTGTLSSLTPVNPILSFNTDDPRFVASKDIIAELDSNQNLAIMDWHGSFNITLGTNKQ